MPYRIIGREVTRGTICRDRWRATITIMCSDRIPAGQPSRLLVDVAWRRQRDGGKDPGRPDDAQPITLTLRKLTPAASGDIRFDGLDGPTTKGFGTDTRTLLTIYGQSATAGAEADVMLDVAIEGDVRDSVPLSVGTVTPTVEIRASNGVDAAPALLSLGGNLELKAVTTPATAGDFRWMSALPATLEIDGNTQGESVQVIGRAAATATELLCVLFTPGGGGPAVMAVHTLTIASPYTGTIEDRSVAPDYTVATTGHHFLPAGTAFEIVDGGGNVVFSGTTEAGGSFSAPLIPGPTYELRIANYAGLGP